MDSSFLQSLVGRTIGRVEVVKEKHEAWQYSEENEVIIHFTDGTSFLFSAMAQHADELFLEVERVDMSANELLSYRKEEMKRKRQMDKQTIEKNVQVGEERKRKAFFMNKLISQIVAEMEENE